MLDEYLSLDYIVLMSNEKGIPNQTSIFFIPLSHSDYIAFFANYAI